MNRFAISSATVCGLLATLLVGNLAAQGQQSTAAPADLTSVIQILRDSGTTSLQEERLVGKVYSGIITIEDVRVSPEDKAVVFVEADYGNDSKQYWKMRFEIPKDDRALQLKKGSKVRFVGTLTGFPIVRSIYIGGTPTRWAVLTHARVE